MIENQGIAFATRSELLFEYFSGVFIFFVIFFAFAGVFLEKYCADKKITLRGKMIFLVISGFFGCLFWFFYSYDDYFSSFYGVQCGKSGEKSFVHLRFLFKEKYIISDRVNSRRGLSGYRGGHTWTYRIFLENEYGYKSISLTMNELKQIQSIGQSCGFVEGG